VKIKLNNKNSRLSPTDFYVEVDTLLGEATVVLPSISTIMEIVAKLGITFASGSVWRNGTVLEIIA
jgi:hypothetical protein